MNAWDTFLVMFMAFFYLGKPTKANKSLALSMDLHYNGWVKNNVSILGHRGKGGMKETGYVWMQKRELSMQFLLPLWHSEHLNIALFGVMQKLGNGFAALPLCWSNDAQFWNLHGFAVSTALPDSPSQAHSKSWHCCFLSNWMNARGNDFPTKIQRFHIWEEIKN